MREISRQKTREISKGVREEIASKIRKHLTATPHGVKVMAERSKTDLCVVAAAVVVDVVEEFLVVDVHRR